MDAFEKAISPHDAHTLNSKDQRLSYVYRNEPLQSDQRLRSSFRERLAVARQSSRQGAKVVAFHLLKGRQAEDQTLHAWHAV